MTEPTLKQPTISRPDGEIVGQHQFPWKPSEFVGLATVAAAGVGIMVISQFAAGAVLFGGALIASVPYFIWLSNGRKKKSLIGVVQQGDQWLFTRRNIHDSSDANVSINVNNVARIDMVDYTGMPNALVLIERDNELTGHKALAIPQRLLRDLAFRGRVTALASQPGIHVGKRAAEALDLK